LSSKDNLERYIDIRLIQGMYYRHKKDLNSMLDAIFDGRYKRKGIKA